MSGFENNLELLKEHLLVDVLINIEKINNYTNRISKQDYFENVNNVATEINDCLYRISANLLKFKIQYPDVSFPTLFRKFKTIPWSKYIKAGMWVRRNNIRTALIWQKAWKLAKEKINDVKRVIRPLIIPILFNNLSFYILQVENCLKVCQNKMEKVVAECIFYYLNLIDDLVDTLDKYCLVKINLKDYFRTRDLIQSKPHAETSNHFPSIVSEGIVDLKRIVDRMCRR